MKQEQGQQGRRIFPRSHISDDDLLQAETQNSRDNRKHGKGPVQLTIAVFIEITGQEQKDKYPQDLIDKNLEGIY